MPVIAALQGLLQENCNGFDVSLGYTLSFRRVGLLSETLF